MKKNAIGKPQCTKVNVSMIPASDCSWQSRQGTLTRQSRNVAFGKVEMSPCFRFARSHSLCAHCAACGGTRQGFPSARARTARGLDGTRRKPKTNFPEKREWKLLGVDAGDISILPGRRHFYFAATKQDGNVLLH